MATKAQNLALSGYFNQCLTSSIVSLYMVVIGGLIEPLFDGAVGAVPASVP